MRAGRYIYLFIILIIVAGASGAAGAQWKPIGPWGGECWEVFLHPTAGDTVFAVGPAGIHKTTDHGDNWRPVYTTEMTGYFMALAFDSSDPQTMLAAGTGTGVWRSTDGGETWSPLDNGLPGGEKATDVVSLASNADGFWLGTRHGDSDGFVWRLDGGSWVKADDGLMLDPPVEEAELDQMQKIMAEKAAAESAAKPTGEAEDDREPASDEDEAEVENTNPKATQLVVDADGRLWAGVYGGGVFRLDGDKWTLLTKAGQGRMMPTSLVPYYGKAKTLYFGTQDDWIWYTVTDGRFWKRMQVIDMLKEDALPLVQELEIDPVNPKLMRVGMNSFQSARSYPLFHPLQGQEGGGIAWTLDRGQNWNFYYHHATGYANNITIDPQSVVDDERGPHAANVWTTNYGQRAISRSEVGNRTASDAFNGYNAEIVQSLCRDSKGRLFAATGDGIDQPDDEYGWVWLDMDKRGSFVFGMTEDPSNSERLLYAVGYPARGAAARRGIFRANVHNWYPVIWPRAKRVLRQDEVEPLLKETPCWTVAASPAQPETIWAGTQLGGIMVSRDAGEEWTEFNWGLKDEASVTKILLDEAGEALYCGLRSSDGAVWSGRVWQAVGGESGSVWKFDKAAQQWSRLDGMNWAVYDLTDAGGVLRAATSAGLFEYVSSTGEWRVISDGLPEKVITCLAVDAANPQRLYAGTRVSGVWLTEDGGQGWTDVSAGMLEKECWRMVVDPNDFGHAWVATLGGGVYELGGE